jgi:hypothetical protein
LAIFLTTRAKATNATLAGLENIEDPIPATLLGTIGPTSIARGQITIITLLGAHQQIVSANLGQHDARGCLGNIIVVPPPTSGGSALAECAIRLPPCSEGNKEPCRILVLTIIGSTKTKDFTTKRQAAGMLVPHGNGRKLRAGRNLQLPIAIGAPADSAAGIQNPATTAPTRSHLDKDTRSRGIGPIIKRRAPTLETPCVPNRATMCMADPHPDKRPRRWRRLTVGVAAPANDFSTVLREFQSAGMLGTQLHIGKGTRGGRRPAATVVTPTGNRSVEAQGARVAIAGDHLLEVTALWSEQLIVSVVSPALNIGVSIEQTSVVAPYRDPVILGHRTSARLAKTHPPSLDLTTAVAPVSREEISIVTGLTRCDQTITAIGLGKGWRESEQKGDQTEKVTKMAISFCVHRGFLRDAPRKLARTFSGEQNWLRLRNRENPPVGVKTPLIHSILSIRDVS